ncbi:hypothetical protein KLP40_14470 [Hymenobacter sp. NST-14]|nr:hypothetical protein [Hymenobacter piscis]MBT9394372.1 hypothetical protein [Hymenobacter piscis]
MLQVIVNECLDVLLYDATLGVSYYRIVRPQSFPQRPARGSSVFILWHD